MKPAEFWAETPAGLIEWIGTVTKHSVKRDTTLAWQIANLMKVGFHAPKKFPDLDKLVSVKPKKTVSKQALLADARLAELMAMPIDPAKVPSWAKEKKKR